MKAFRVGVFVPIVAALILAGGNAFATSILVNNFSFENGVSGPLPNSCGAGCSYTLDNVISGWTVNTNMGAVAGLLEPGAGQFTSVPNGVTVAYSNGGTISQTVGPTVVAGTVYTLMVDIGLRSDVSSGPLGTAELLIGGTTPIVATGVAPTAGHFSEFTAVYTGTVADAGKTIGIVLTSTGPQGNFDDVLLDASAVPEPTTLSLLGLGLVGIAIGIKRKRA